MGVRDQIAFEAARLLLSSVIEIGGPEFGFYRKGSCPTETVLFRGERGASIRHFEAFQHILYSIGTSDGEEPREMVVRAYKLPRLGRISNPRGDNESWPFLDGVIQLRHFEVTDPRDRSVFCTWSCHGSYERCYSA